MAEKKNPWLDEGTRYDDNKPKKDIRDMKFTDNSSHSVRILPAKKADEYPFFGYKQHWIPQNNSTTGKPITHGIDERCAVCKWISEQWDEIHRLKEEEDMTDKSPEVKALLDKVGKVSAKTRYDMNIFHREDMYVVDEETGEKKIVPKRMSAGGTVYKEIFNFAKKWGSPSSEDTGYDLEIKTTGSKEKREYSVIPDRDASPITPQEKKAFELLYDLKNLRKNSTKDEIKKVLENAKAPYNVILDYVADGDDNDDDTSNDNNSATDSVEDVEKEIEEVVAKKTTKTTEESKAKKEEKVVEEKKQEVEQEGPEETTSSDDDENNIEMYECKGDYDEGDKMCSDCPVKNDCEAVHPFYVKAKQLKIDVDPTRLTKEVVEEVKKTEQPAEAPTRGKKRIPF